MHTACVKTKKGSKGVLHVAKVGVPSSDTHLGCPVPEWVKMGGVFLCLPSKDIPKTKTNQRLLLVVLVSWIRSNPYLALVLTTQFPSLEINWSLELGVISGNHLPELLGNIDAGIKTNLNCSPNPTNGSCVSENSIFVGLFSLCLFIL